MLKYMKYTKLLLVFLMISLCSCNHKESVEIDLENSATIINEQTTNETIVSTTTDIKNNTTAETTMGTTTEATVAAIESSDYNQYFKAIEYVCYKLWNGYYKDPYDVFNGSEHIIYDNEIDFFMNNVSKIENSTLGEITDKQDLIVKSKDVFIEVLGQDFIDQVEADYCVKNGVKLAIVERTTPVYYIEYYDEYDIWYIYPCMPSGKLEDGSGLDRIYEWGAFLMVRGRDGKIIACRF